MILRLLNEAVACLREGIVADEDLLDAGAIFGFGFAPFRGGPMHYLRSEGVVRSFGHNTASRERLLGAANATYFLSAAKPLECGSLLPPLKMQ